MSVYVGAIVGTSTTVIYYLVTKNVDGRLLHFIESVTYGLLSGFLSWLGCEILMSGEKILPFINAISKSLEDESKCPFHWRYKYHILQEKYIGLYSSYI